MSQPKSEPSPPADVSFLAGILAREMHYYQFNIGDYQSHTGHLDPLEDIAYRRMLDWSYLHETPLPDDATEISRKIRMRGHEDVIKAVLKEFFTLADAGWYQNRIAQEIKTFHSKIEQASRAGKASAERRSNARSTDVQPTNNHKPETKNQEPVLPSTNVLGCPADAEPAPEKPTKYPGCDHKAVVSLYHGCLPNLPACEVWNESRAGLLRQRWREVAVELDKEGKVVTKTELLDWWERFFDHVGRSKFLTGKAPGGKDRRPFMADLEWLIRPTNFAKIIENRYHGD